MEHYLDNSATTRVLESAAQKAVFLMTEEYGNPSSLHTRGFRAKCELEDAREVIAKSVGASPQEILFTSGGTEGNNLAILGAARAKKRRGNKIVTAAIEHSSVLEAVNQLEKEGFEIVRLLPDGEGRIDPEALADAIDERTVLVSMMLVNNEIGSIQPVQAAAQAIRRKKLAAVLHTDAVQAYLKMPLSVAKLGVDLLTVSGHKVHAPKGVGALYIKQGLRILPSHFGGGQERRLRAGTESLPLIGAFAEAVRGSGSIAESAAHVRSINTLLRGELAAIDGVEILSPESGLPYILSLSAGKIKAETMLHFLSAKGIYVSSGSACGKGKPSHVLTAMGLAKPMLESMIRVSFSRFSTEEDARAFTAALREGIEQLHHA